MKATTAGYREAMEQRIRNQSSVEIVFDNSDPSALTDGKWAANGTVPWSESVTLDYDYDYGPTVCTTELNRCMLGDRFFFPSRSTVGIKDGLVSDQIGSFVDGPYNVTTIFSRKFSRPHSFPCIEIWFDTRCKEYPDHVEIIYKLQSGGEKKQFYLLFGYVQLFNLPGENVTEVTVKAGWIIPGHHPRVERVVFGRRRSFGNKDLVKAVQKHDVDPITRRLPKEDFEFQIIDLERAFDSDNPQGVWKYVSERSPVSIRYGILSGDVVQWIKGDRYVMNGKPRFENGIVTFKCTGLLGSMTSVYYKSKLGRKSFYDMAQDVLLDAGLTPKPDGGNPWVIGDELKGLYTTSVLPIAKTTECLQMIAHACGCSLYTDDDNIIHIERPKWGSEYQTGTKVDKSSITDKTQKATRTLLLQGVRVNVYSLTPADSASTLYEGTTSEPNVHIEFQAAKDVTVTVNGSAPKNYTVYAQAVDISGLSGTSNVKITGRTLSESSTQIYLDNSEPNGDVDTISNKLVSDAQVASELAKITRDWLSLRNTYDMDYRGNPEIEVGDNIKTETDFSRDVDALVLTDEIVFDGALHGKIKLKGYLFSAGDTKDTLEVSE